MSIYLDFEFCQTAEETMRLVCCSTITSDGDLKEWWLDRDVGACQRLYEYIDEQVQAGETLISWNVESEARCLFDLGFDALDANWVDLYLEYKMLQNHDAKLLYDLQYIDGKVKRLPLFGEKGKSNLAAATYKLLGIMIDSEHKDKMRDLIISNPPKFTDEEKKDIMTYCSSDVKHLKEIFRQIIKTFNQRIKNTQQRKLYIKEAHVRADYAVRSAKMVKLGYPVNVEWVKNLTENVPLVLEECIRDINSQFPDIKPFRFKLREGNFSMNTKNIKEWVKKQGHKNWETTETGDISLSLDAWTKYYNYSHTYPRGNFGAQMVRFLKLKQSLNGFSNKTRQNKSFWDYLGSDGRVRPYFNIYGAQSSRSQPASTGYVFLKPAWQRSLVQPKGGRAIAGIDYSSEEFLLSALVSKDKKMLAAYKSGDVYLAFGKEIGLIPKEGTKQTHKFERDLCKSTILGLSYLMSEFGLAYKLTQDTGKVHTEEEALELVNAFNHAYPDFSFWREQTLKDYKIEGHIKLECGWYMWGDNPNFRSVANVPIQGLGASIMRRAVFLAQEAGLDVIMTLHDAIYIEYDSGDFEKIKILKDCMMEAFCHYFEDKKSASCIRMEGETWSPDYDEKIEERQISIDGMPLHIEQLHIDERAIEEYKKFNIYFKSSPRLDLLGDVGYLPAEQI